MGFGVHTLINERLYMKTFEGEEWPGRGGLCELVMVLCLPELWVPTGLSATTVKGYCEG